MPRVLENPHRGRGLPGTDDIPLPLSDAAPVEALLARCPAHLETPLRACPEVAAEAGVAEVWLKDERSRMGLGSFKALGAAHAIARAAMARGGDLSLALKGETFVTASAGNHGLSLAAGARVFGAASVIYLAETVPRAFARRLEGAGACVVTEGADYADSMAAAETAASAQGWTLLSDSSWHGYTDWPLRVMEGYLALAAEAVRQLPVAPSHILLQAGVGGLAAAVAAHARTVWGDAPRIVVVEPEAAPALFEGIRAGRLVETIGPASTMGRLDCKTASLIALKGLARDADAFALISEDAAQDATGRLAQLGLRTTPSGAAGIAALLYGLEMPTGARVLAILTEAGEDA